MKYTYITLLLLSLCTILSSGSCKKENNNSFYFKCKINGEEYVPNRCANCITCTILRDKILMLGANRGFESVNIGVNDATTIGVKTYTLNNMIGRQAAYDNSPVVSDIFKTDSINNGELQITNLDKANNIISGKFYFKAYNPIQNKTVNITDGSFRLRYTTY